MSEDLGLSISTISRALNNSSEIGDKTKTKIKKAALKHGYVPNILARNLANNPTDVVVVTVPQINTIDYKKLFKEVISTPQLKNYKNSMYQTKNSKNYLKLISQISKGNVHGIVVLCSDDCDNKQ